MKRPDNLKVGDKFVLTQEAFNFPAGTLIALRRDDGTNSPSFDFPDGDWHYVNFSLLRPLEKTWDNLEVGDIIKGEYGNKAKVLAVLPGVFLRSYRGNFKKADDWYAVDESREFGWTIEGSQEEVTELSMQEIADKFGVSVEQLRVKKEA